MGAYMKGVAIYDHAWWRDRGLSGLAFADRGPVQMTVDASPAGGSPGVLVGFVTGAPARALAELEPSARRQVVLEAMAAAVAPEAASPRSYRDFNWLEEPWSRGGPVGLMGPGTLTGLGPGAAGAGRAGPLGGHGHGDRVERLHGGRDPGGRARGRRGGSGGLGRELLDAVAAGAARRLDGRLLALGQPQQGSRDGRLRGQLALGRGSPRSARRSSTCGPCRWRGRAPRRSSRS